MEAAMMGTLVAAEPLFYMFRLENHAPCDYSPQTVGRLLDIALIRQTVTSHHSTSGRL